MMNGLKKPEGVLELWYPVIPLKGVVIFPQSSMPVYVERPKAIQALSGANAQTLILLVAQKNPSTEDPTTEDLYPVGTLAKIQQLTESPNGTRKILVKGISRFTIEAYQEIEGGLLARGKELVTEEHNTKTIEATCRLITDNLQRYLKALNKKKIFDPLPSIIQISDKEHMTDLLAMHLEMSIENKQAILSFTSLEKRLETIITYLKTEIEVSQVQKRILDRIKQNVKKNQEEYTQHIKNQAIRDELGDPTEFDLLEQKFQATRLPSEVKKKVEGELRRLKSMNAMSSEAVVSRTYLEFLFSLPWSKKNTLETNLLTAESILDKEHFGLSKIKKIIIEHIAVYNRTKKPQGMVLCFVGPPGVGKTSLGQIIAKATKRDFARVALGGVRDEAEIRGHRRTYVGSLPGSILNAIRKCGSRNPVLMFDEIDKMGNDFRGDPASALLEVLDPEQNAHFVDHYLEIPFPLNEAMFICTANRLDHIPYPLLDRMEVISLSSYNDEEKIEIARRHLLPRQMIVNGMKENEFKISDEALRLLIREYTREAGVRNLDRKIGSLIRQAVTLIDSKKMNHEQVHVMKTNLAKYAGAPPFSSRNVERKNEIGIVNGLAWNEAGGDILPIEAILVPGKGQVMATGKLGDVMQESVKIAFGFLRSRASYHGVDLSILKDHDIQVHMPEGAIPKDGPSAGVALYLSMLSALLNLPIRSNFALTGEISLTGRVWTIGGLKEKILAAYRAGIEKVFIPQGNMKNLDDIPDNVKKAVSIAFMSYADELLPYALMGYKPPVTKIL